MSETFFLCGGSDRIAEGLEAQGYRPLRSLSLQEDLLRLVVGEADLFVLQGEEGWSPTPRACMETLAALKSGCRFAVAEEDEEGLSLRPIEAAEVVALLRQAPALAEVNAPYEPIVPSSLTGDTHQPNRLAGLIYRRAAIKPKAATTTGSGGGNAYDDEVDNKDSETVNEPILSFEGRAV